MATPLQYKRRVRLPDEPWLPVTHRRRRVPVALLALGVWVGLAALCASIATGAVPVARWLGATRTPLSLRTAESQPRAVRAQSVEAAGRDRGAVAGSTSSAPPEQGIEPAPLGSGRVRAPSPARRPSRPRPPDVTQGIDPFAAGDGFGDSARDTGEATVDDAPSMATSSGIGRTSCQAAIDTDESRKGPLAATSPAARHIAKVVDSGRWFSGCGSVQRFEVHLCIAVRNGRAVGVTVHTLPAHRDIVRCIANQAWGLRFPKSPRLDVARASFAPD